jgi:hypothetical protein
MMMTENIPVIFRAGRLVTVLLVCAVLTGELRAQSSGALRLVNMNPGTIEVCLIVDGAIFCAAPYAATERVRIPAGERIVTFVVRGAASSDSLDTTVTVPEDSSTTVVFMGRLAEADSRVALLRVPLDASIPDSIARLRIVHATAASDVGRLDIVFRLANAATIRRDRFAYGSATTDTAVVPGPFNVYGYYSDFASTDMVLDEGGAIAPATSVTAFISGSTAAGNVGVHVLEEGDTTAHMLTRLEDRSTLTAPLAPQRREVSIAPNPATTVVRVKIDRAWGGVRPSATIVDLLGREVGHGVAAPGGEILVIEVSELEVGVYGVVVAWGANDVRTLPLVVRR